MEWKIEANRISACTPEGRLLAEVTYPALHEEVVVIDHTFVDDSLRGQGIAGTLMEALVQELRTTKRKARPACSYAAAWFEKHPQARDVLDEG